MRLGIVVVPPYTHTARRLMPAPLENITMYIQTRETLSEWVWCNASAATVN